jgi:hypothetical protein
VKKRRKGRVGGNGKGQEYNLVLQGNQVSIPFSNTTVESSYQTRVQGARTTRENAISPKELQGQSAVAFQTSLLMLFDRPRPIQNYVDV